MSTVLCCVCMSCVCALSVKLLFTVQVDQKWYALSLLVKEMREMADKKKGKGHSKEADQVGVPAAKRIRQGGSGKAKSRRK